VTEHPTSIYTNLTHFAREESGTGATFGIKPVSPEVPTPRVVPPVAKEPYLVPKRLKAESKGDGLPERGGDRKGSYVISHEDVHRLTVPWGGAFFAPAGLVPFGGVRRDGERSAAAGVPTRQSD
jgi:hypothetical protein